MERLEDRLLKLNDDNLAAHIIQNNDIQNCLVELSEYKDTKLTPEEITALKIKSESALDPIEMAKVAIALRERDTLKKALELMATYLVHFGRLDEMLCNDIPQSLHLKYQPKNDGEYENEPCIKCVQEFYIQQAQEGQE